MQTTLRREVYQLHAEICHALSDPNRILILYELREGRRNVGELAENLAISQPTVSRHLGILKQGGLVTTRQDGASVFYRLQNEETVQLLQQLTELLKRKLQVDQELLKGVEES